MFNFQKLEIYRLAKEIVKNSYELTKDFPPEEKYSIIQQMNRAAVSIPSNIAEGTSRNGAKEKIHFINISYGSLMELICQMEISHELGYIKEGEYTDFLVSAKNLSVKLSNYTNAVKQKETNYR